jgi:hypothetical protein
MIALSPPSCRTRVSNTVYPFSRSPFKYASNTLRSAVPSICLRTNSLTSYDIVVDERDVP